jgi:hypothetical protein
MSDISPSQRIDTARPDAAAEYLRICREILANLNAGEAMARFLEEVASQFHDTDEDLALYLRQQAGRIGTGDEIRHSVRRGVPPVATVRQQVGERLRREEDRRRGAAAESPKPLRSQGCLLSLGLGIAVGLGAAVWGLLWLIGVDNPWGLIIGIAVGAALGGAFHVALRHALAHLLEREGENPKQ